MPTIICCVYNFDIFDPTICRAKTLGPNLPRTLQTTCFHNLECDAISDLPGKINLFNVYDFALPVPVKSGVSGNDFRTFGNGNGNGSAHSQTLGTGMKNCIPIFWEREWIFHSLFLGSGTGMEIAFPNFGNGNETLLFPGMIGNRNGNEVKNRVIFLFCCKNKFFSKITI